MFRYDSSSYNLDESTTKSVGENICIMNLHKNNKNL